MWRNLISVTKPPSDSYTFDFLKSTVHVPDPAPIDRLSTSDSKSICSFSSSFSLNFESDICFTFALDSNDIRACGDSICTYLILSWNSKHRVGWLLPVNGCDGLLWTRIPSILYLSARSCIRAYTMSCACLQCSTSLHQCFVKFAYSCNVWFSAMHTHTHTHIHTHAGKGTR